MDCRFLNTMSSKAWFKAWFSSHGLAAEAPQNCQNRIADLYIDIEPEKFVFMQDVQDTDTKSVNGVVMAWYRVWTPLFGPKKLYEMQDTDTESVSDVVSTLSHLFLVKKI